VRVCGEEDATAEVEMLPVSRGRHGRTSDRRSRVARGTFVAASPPCGLFVQRYNTLSILVQGALWPVRWPFVQG
jgi:hypothetical protein